MNNIKQDNMKVLGNWLPDDKVVLKNWVEELISEVKTKNKLRAKAANASIDKITDEELIEFKHKEVIELKNLIEEDAGLFVLANKMIQQALNYSKEDPTGSPQIDSYILMLQLIDTIMDTTPEYNPPETKGHSLIGFPINAVLNWCMGTSAGHAFFMDSRVNERFKEILNSWCEFLNSPDSRYVLYTGKETEEKKIDIKNSWLSDKAKEELHIDDFKYDASADYGGFSSWNDFFIRQFKDIDTQRPVASPEDDSIIVSACESASYRISADVQKNQNFWLKGQPYSLEYMLNENKINDPQQHRYSNDFVGGTVYQAFLSATKYHRWHSPVSGRIEKIEIVPGTYYSELRSYPFDDAGPNNSQGFITQVATRAIIYIRCPEPIGIMCFIAVGMAEVSSCIVTVKEGQNVKKGDQLGYFQFGGSTHCLIFRKDVIQGFVLDAIPAPDFNDSKIIKVRSKLAIVNPDKKN